MLSDRSFPETIEMGDEGIRGSSLAQGRHSRFIPLRLAPLAKPASKRTQKLRLFGIVRQVVHLKGITPQVKQFFPWSVLIPLD